MGVYFYMCDFFFFVVVCFVTLHLFFECATNWIKVGGMDFCFFLLLLFLYIRYIIKNVIDMKCFKKRFHLLCIIYSA